jgi:formylglycine-generating enzyme required for sulfatase activity
MHKLKFYSFCIPAGILLLIIAACNLPGFVGEVTSPPAEENTSTPGEISEHPAGASNTDGAETMLIPAGSFWMGSTDTEPLAAADEMPFHQVTLDAFYFYTHEVTNEMYAKCVEAGACITVDALASGPTSQSGDPAHANFPVVGADWIMADDYCTWAGGRLPTEAEWEYAARGTESLLYPWGAEAPACDRVNMLGCVVPPDTAAVGSYELGNSPYKVWDMAGNAWEWVHDWYAEGTYALSAAVNPLGPYSYQDVNHPLKVVRGGGLYSEPVALRTASRQSADPHRPYDDVGFRCVAMSDLVFPEAYVPVDEVHERVPPDSLDGGGEHVEEPDGDTGFGIGFGELIAACPTEEGRLSIDIPVHVTCADPIFTFTVEGIPYTCAYNPTREVLHCEGDLPADYADLARVSYLLRVDCSGGVARIGGNIPWRDECEPGGSVPIGVFGNIYCPVAGLFNINIGCGVPVVWDFTRLVTSTEEIDIPCVPLPERRMICTAPDLSEGGYYRFHLHGTTADGTEVEVARWLVPVLADCTAETRDVNVTSLCYEGHPSAQVTYVPVTDVLTRVSTTGGMPLACIGMAPGVQICGDLPGRAGSDTPITTCFEGSPCTNWPLTAPDCTETETDLGFEIQSRCYLLSGQVAIIRYTPMDQPIVSADADGTALVCEADAGGYTWCSGIPGAAGDEKTITFCLADGSCYSQAITLVPCGEEVPSGGTEVEYTIEPTCYPPDAAGISLHYWPFDLPLVDVNANGAWLTCDNMGGGYYLCSGLPGAVGAEKTITFCLEGYYCMGDDVIVPACEGEVPSGEDWRMLAYGCHSETMIYFIVSTGIDWLVPGAPVTIGAADGVTTYSCDIHPTIPGQLYCSGLNPAAPSALAVCIQRAGDPPICHTWTGWHGTEATIPSCIIAVPPPPVEPAPSCYDYGIDPVACAAHGCRWDKGPPYVGMGCFPP